jgi:putative SOS response-associated peptidase YedK
MCGRFSFTASKEKIQEQFGPIETGSNLRINFNIAPTQHAYVITNDSPRKLQYITWGLIPHWSKDGKNAGKLINARMEGIAGKPSFRVPIRNRRCWVLADSFYEWRRENGRKIPYRILMEDERIMVLAGIWDVWYQGDYAVKSFSIITAPPNREISAIHNRMPVILNQREAQQNWLENQPLDEVLSLLHTPEDGILHMYRVSERVNSVRNNGPELHEPEAEPPSLFDV